MQNNQYANSTQYGALNSISGLIGGGTTAAPTPSSEVAGEIESLSVLLDGLSQGLLELRGRLAPVLAPEMKNASGVANVPQVIMSPLGDVIRGSRFRVSLAVADLREIISLLAI
jgi:hypothetical protein